MTPDTANAIGAVVVFLTIFALGGLVGFAFGRESERRRIFRQHIGPFQIRSLSTHAIDQFLREGVQPPMPTTRPAPTPPPTGGKAA